MNAEYYTNAPLVLIISIITITDCAAHSWTLAILFFSVS
jgi:hypothetical protein